MSHNANASDTMNKSVGHFSKRDHLKEDEVGILHNAEAFPCDEALIYSVKENSVKIFPMRRRCVKSCNDAEGKSNNDTQWKSTMKSSTPVGARNQLVDLLSTITLHWNNLELCADTPHASD